jgi:hypothetical protein
MIFWAYFVFPVSLVFLVVNETDKINHTDHMNEIDQINRLIALLRKKLNPQLVPAIQSH